MAVTDIFIRIHVALRHYAFAQISGILLPGTQEEAASTRG